MKFHLVDDNQLEQVKDLWDYCFEKREEPFFKFYFQEYCLQENNVIGGFEQIDDSEYLRTMVHINPYRLQIRGQELPVPYLVGVATAPEARGQHLMGKLMKTTFEALRTQGIFMAFLMPIYAGIYTPYEFAFCYDRLKYVWEIGSLALPPLDAESKKLTLVYMQVKSSEQNEEAPIYDEALAEILGYVYDAYTAEINGAPKRNDMQWHKLLTAYVHEQLKAIIVHKDGVPQGYMLYRICEQRFEVVELVALTMAAKLRMLAFIEGHKSEAKQAEYLAEAWDKTYSYLLNAEQAPQKRPFMMARCIDAKGLLQGMKKLPKDAEELKGSLVLLLRDSVLQRNNQLLELHCQGGKLEVQNSIDKEQVSMDMSAFTQMFMGYMTATELADNGKLQCTDVEALRFLDKLFPKQRNWINEYF